MSTARVKNLEIALKKLRKFWRLRKRLPTYQEMADFLGFASKNTAFKLTQKLIALDFLQKDDKGKLIPKKLLAPMGIFGTVPAGFPTLSEEYRENSLSLDEYLVHHPEATFLLKVSGDSMLQAGIHPGDLLIVEKGKNPKMGDIVVANVDNEWTLKYFITQNGRVVLQAANPKYPRIRPRQHLEIGGIVVGMVRRYK